MKAENDMLVIDDEEERVKPFRADGIKVTRTFGPQTTIGHTLGLCYPIICLDHDMGWGNMNGVDVVKTFGERLILITPFIVVWSHNPIGSLSMQHILSDFEHNYPGDEKTAQVIRRPYGANDKDFYKNLIRKTTR